MTLPALMLNLHYIFSKGNVKNQHQGNIDD